MTQAIEAYRKVMVSTEFRELERLRADARHNEASALLNARATIARNMLKRNRPLDEIVEDTGLTHAEVEALRDAN